MLRRQKILYKNSNNTNKNPIVPRILHLGPGDHIDVKIIYGFQLFLQIKYMVSLYEIGKGGFSRCFSSDSSNYVIKYINKRK